MSKKRLIVLFCAVCVAIFQNGAADAQSQMHHNEPPEETNASELAPNINLLQGEQDSDTDAVSIDVSRLAANGEATAATYEKRQILFQRLVDAHAQGRENDTPEDIAMTLSDAAIEDIFAGYSEGEEEEIDLDMVADFVASEQQLEDQEESDEKEDDDDIDSEEEEYVAEDEPEESKSVLDILNEHKVAVAVVGTGIVLGGGAASYVMKKKDNEENEISDEDDYEDEDEEDYEADEEESEEYEEDSERTKYVESENYEGFDSINTKTASADPEDLYLSLGGVAEAGELQGDSAAVDTGAVSRVVNADIFDWAGNSAIVNRSIFADSGITAEDIESHMHGVLVGQGELIYQTAKKYGIDPAFFAAIPYAENRWGEDLHGIIGHGEPYNVYSLLDDHEYTSVEENIKAAGEVVEWYINDFGVKTIGEFQQKFCPVGVENDPTGLNENWLDGVSAGMKLLGVYY